MAYFISDTHFGHKRILQFEPSRQQWQSTHDMDEALIQDYNETVEEGDLVFWLGDVFFCNAARMEYIVGKLKPTRNILIRGNHDKGITDSKFKRLGFYPVRMYYYKGAMLTHEPISETNMNHLRDLGIRYNIHGHLHSDVEGMDPLKYQCVSVEMTNFHPITFSQVMDRFYSSTSLSV